MNTSGIEPDEADRQEAAYQDLIAALKVAFELSRDAAAAGLVVTALSPHQCQGRYGCHFIQLWQPDGRLWAEASHETTDEVRGHIAGYARQAAGHGATVPDGDDMPVFVIKGKDQFAPHAISYYAALCRRAGLTGQAAEVRRAVAEIQDWQSDHRDKVKLPDHPHVPVTAET